MFQQNLGLLHRKLLEQHALAVATCPLCLPPAPAVGGPALHGELKSGVEGKHGNSLKETTTVFCLNEGTQACCSRYYSFWSLYMRTNASIRTWLGHHHPHVV